jgi:RNase P subunit RPR2
LDLPEVSEKLKEHRTRIYKLIKTDYKKQPDKIAMLRREVEMLQKINGRARMIAENDPASLDNEVKRHRNSSCRSLLAK